MKIGGRILELERRAYTALRARADRRLAARAPRPKPQHLLTGERGEAAAYFYLRSLGYKVVARRWLNERHRGDVDLIAWDGRTLVAVEVKTRTARDLYEAADAVDREKRNQLRLHLGTYLKRFPEPFRQQVTTRFDILSVYLLAGGAEFEHQPDAFPRADARDRPRPWQ